MPCVTLHCIVHLLPDGLQETRFPAIWTIRNSPPGSPANYSLLDMILWSTIPYTTWQLSYHFLITVRRREKIAAGRPTSFTWLRRSYSKAWIGKFVISLPEYLQEPAFMLIQYMYALLTMMPCPIWFWYRYPSACFLMAVFCWSIYNGATYYIDVFGKRFQNELEAMKREVQKWQNSPEPMTSPLMTPKTDASGVPNGTAAGAVAGTSNGELSKALDAAADDEKSHDESGNLALAAAGAGGLSPPTPRVAGEELGYMRSRSVDSIPLLDREGAGTGLDGGAKDVARERRIGEMPA
jgi:hypothetical protein